MPTQLLPATADRDDWLAARRPGIGASEIAAVLGISPWESPFSLYWRKANGWDYEPTSEMEWGTRLEDAIAAKWADSNPLATVERAGLIAGDEPWKLATPDRLVRLSPSNPTSVLEVKTAHSAHDGWGPAGTSEVPVHYRAQVLWQMHVLGCRVGYMAVLIGGSDYREYAINLDEADVRVMVHHGRRFMARLAAGDPPPIDDHAATLGTLKRLHPDLVDDDVEVAAATAEGYRRARALKRRAEAAVTRFETRLRAEMGPHRRAMSGGAFVASRSIYEVAESVRPAYTVDRLNPAREKKQ